MRQWISQSPRLQRAFVREDINVFGHRWNPPKWDYIQPLEDAKADAMQLAHMLNSPTRLQARRGRRWEEVASEYVTDYGMIIRLAKEEAAAINAEFEDDPVSWREIIPLVPREQMTMQVNATEEEEPEPAPAPQLRPETAAALQVLEQMNGHGS